MNSLELSRISTLVDKAEMNREDTVAIPTRLARELIEMLDHYEDMTEEYEQMEYDLEDAQGNVKDLEEEIGSLRGGEEG